MNKGMIVKSKKRDDEGKEFDLNSFRTKHFAHFAFKGHVSQCQCQPDHPDGCPFKANFGSTSVNERIKEEQ